MSNGRPSLDDIWNETALIAPRANDERPSLDDIWSDTNSSLKKSDNAPVRTQAERPPNESSYLQDVGTNFSQGIKSAKDLASGNFSLPGYQNASTPKTGALGEKLFEGLTDIPTDTMGIARLIFKKLKSGEIGGADLASAEVEKFHETPTGKALDAIGGIHPELNLAGTAIGKYVAPKISEATGLTPDQVELGAMAIPAAGYATKTGRNLASSISAPSPITKGITSLAKNSAEGAVRNTSEGAKNIAEGIRSHSPEELEGVAATLKDRANASYAAADAAGVGLSDVGVSRILSETEKAIDSIGPTHGRLHADTAAILNDFKDLAMRGNVTLQDMDNQRRLFRGVINRNTDVAGRMNDDGLKAKLALEAIDKNMEELKATDTTGVASAAIDARNEAKKQWATYRKFESISDLVKSAEGDPNAIRNSLKKFVKNKKNLSSFTVAERTALKSASTTSNTERLLTLIGRFGFDINSPTVGNALVPAAAIGLGLSGVPGGIPLAIAGTAARQIKKKIVQGKAQRALNLIGKETGVSKARPSQATISPGKKTSPSLPRP